MKMKLLMTIFLVTSIFFNSNAEEYPPVITISGDNTACTGEVYSYSVVNDPTVYYQWTIVNGTFVSSPTGSNNVDVAWYGIGSITVSTYSDPGFTTLVGSASLSVSVDVLDPYITMDPEVGCLDIKGEQHPDRKFGNDCVKACEDNKIDYIANGKLGSTFEWVVVGDATTIPVSLTGPTIEVEWHSVGFGVVKLIETSANGCVSEVEICVEIIPKPIADFDILPGLTVCVGQTVYFEDLSLAVGSADLTAWEWKVSDGTFQSYTESTDFSHVFNSGGTFEVTLTVYNTCGCYDSYTVEINVISDPGPEIFCPKVVCPNEKTKIYTNSTCGSYFWAVDNGTIISGLGTNTITVMWDDTPDGVGYVQLLTPCGACNIPTILEIPIVGTTLDIEGPIEVCRGDQVTLTAPAVQGTFYNWTLNTPFANANIAEVANNQVIIQVSGGASFTVEVNYFNELAGCGKGCGGTAVHTIIPVTPSNILGVTEVCVGDSQPYYISGPAIGNIKIEKPDGSIAYVGDGASYTFTIDGLHVLTPNNAGCLGPPLLVNAHAIPPIADVITGPTQICPGIPYTYVAGNDIDGTIYSWSAPNGSPSTGSGKEISVAWNPTGPYKIYVQRINVETPNCASAFIDLDVFPITVSPTVSGPISVCANDSEPYSINYLDGEEYSWNIVGQGQGSVITDPNSNAVSVQWNNTTGTAMVIGSVRKCNQWFRDTLDVVISPVSSVMFTTNDSDNVICQNDAITFTADPGYTTYSWSISPTVGGPLPNSANVSEVFPSAGTFNVTLAATDNCGNVSVHSELITVLPEPPSQLSVSTNTMVCNTGGVVISGSATLVTTVIGGTAGYSFAWTRNTIPLIPTTPTIVISDIGTYQVTVTNLLTLCTAVEQVIIVCPSGPGCTMPASNNGAFDYTYDNTTCGEVTFNQTALTTAPGWSLGSSRFYHIGAPNNFDQPGPTYTYSSFDNAGYYNVTYELCFNSGSTTCCRNINQNVVIPVVAEATASAYCDGTGAYMVQLDDFSSALSDLPNGYNATWDVGGVTLPVISNTTSATTTVSLSSLGLTPGVYTVVLQVSVAAVLGMPSNYTCEYSTTLVVPALPNALFTAISPVCEDLDVEFTATGPNGPNSTYDWNFGDGSSLIQTVNTAARKYNGPAGGLGYNVSLTVTNAAGCTATYDDYVDVVTNDFVSPVIDVTPTGAICQPNPATLTFNHSGSATATAFDWSDGAAANPNVVFDAGGYIVTATDGYGCIAVTDLTPVAISPAPSAVIFGESNYCDPDDLPVELFGFAGPGHDYVWMKKPSGGAWTAIGGNNPSISDPAVNSGGSPYEYELTVTDQSTMCSAVTVKTVIINDNPTAPSVTSNITQCNPFTVMLDATTGVSPAYFNWSNGQIGSTINVNHGGLYEVTLTDGNGCSSETLIDVEGEPNLDFFPVGCYEFCKKDQPWNFAGPYGYFDTWELFRNGSSYANGTGFISNLQFMHDGEYYLEVKVGICLYTSGILQVKFNDEKCKKCDKPCDVKLGKIYPEHIQDCLYEFNVDTYLGECTTVIDYKWTVNGVLVPGGALMSYNFPSAGGGYKICVYVVAENEQGKKCEDKVCIEFKPTCKCDCDIEADFDIIQQNCEFKFISNVSTSKCTKVKNYQWTIYQNGQIFDQINGPKILGYGFNTQKPFEVCLTVSGNDGNMKCSDTVCKNIFPCNQNSDSFEGNENAARDNLDSPTIAISPNPFSNNIRIQSEGSIGKEWHIVVIDVTGRLISNNTVTVDQPFLIMSTDAWRSGMYQIHVSDELGNSFVEKIIKVD